MSRTLHRFDLIDPLHLRWLVQHLKKSTSTEVVTHLMDTLSAHYAATQTGVAGRCNAFATAIHGTPAKMRELFVTHICDGDVVFALALFRARPEVVGAQLFCEQYGTILQHVLDSGDLASLEMLWPFLPQSTQKKLGEKILDIWWLLGHRESAVTLAQSTNVPQDVAMLFALAIGRENPQWSALIVEQQCART